MVAAVLDDEPGAGILQTAVVPGAEEATAGDRHLGIDFHHVQLDGWDRAGLLPGVMPLARPRTMTSRARGWNSSGMCADKAWVERSPWEEASALPLLKRAYSAIPRLVISFSTVVKPAMPSRLEDDFQALALCGDPFRRRAAGLRSSRSAPKRGRRFRNRGTSPGRAGPRARRGRAGGAARRPAAQEAATSRFSGREASEPAPVEQGQPGNAELRQADQAQAVGHAQPGDQHEAGRKGAGDGAQGVHGVGRSPGTPAHGGHGTDHQAVHQGKRGPQEDCRRHQDGEDEPGTGSASGGRTGPW